MRRILLTSVYTKMLCIYTGDILPTHWMQLRGNTHLPLQFQGIAATVIVATVDIVLLLRFVHHNFRCLLLLGFQGIRTLRKIEESARLPISTHSMYVHRRKTA